MEVININTRRKYSLFEMIEKLNIDETLSFIAHGYLYFKRDKKILKTKIKENFNHLRECEEVVLTEQTINQSYCLTDYVISQHIRKIKPSEVKENLILGNHLLLALEEYWLSFEVNDDIVNIICTDTQLNELDINDEELNKILADNFLSSLMDGNWYIVINEDE